MKVRVIGVTYRAGDLVTTWVDSLEAAWAARARTEDDRLTVIAVDNASPDDTPLLLRARSPFVTLLAQPHNHGFATGCNRGLGTAEPGEIVVVMNPDVQLCSDFFAVLGGLDWPPDLAARGPQVLDRDGAIEQSARTFPTLATGLFGRTSLLARLIPDSAPVRGQLLARPDDGPREVDWISGACMVAPYERWAAVGNFDEAYFMYWEDADWCRRAHDRGLRIRYEPSLRVRHLQGSSSSYRPVATVLAFHRSAWRYHRLHGRRSAAHDAIAAAGLLLRATFKVALTLARAHRSDDGATAPTHRRRVKNAVLGARIPLKGPVVEAAWRAYEHYLSRHEGSERRTAVDGVAVPPARLRVLTAGTANLTWFLEAGRAHATYLRGLLAEVGAPIDEMDRILDFGCGCGRMLRWWADLSATSVHGCDYNRELVGWCNDHLRFADVRASEASPPSRYEDASFDLVYAFSIFTHLTSDQAERWLTEMHRVVKPGGLVWFTMHGASLTDRLSAADHAEFAAGNVVVHVPEAEGMNLCSAFWPEAAVRSMLGDRFELISHFDPLHDPATAERARMSHDAYLVRRR
jgi:GT2 family glycosyltransferase/2-polyprenyl-3-methyl-5-hydroxy-6-metoxy-1,4-benzoquinol methylase